MFLKVLEKYQSHSVLPVSYVVAHTRVHPILAKSEACSWCRMIYFKKAPAPPNSSGVWRSGSASPSQQRFVFLDFVISFMGKVLDSISNSSTLFALHEVRPESPKSWADCCYVGSQLLIGHTARLLLEDECATTYELNTAANERTPIREHVEYST
ncbi:hypothetical protein AUEXF2481DRAFT_551774 [Aureobasidium subglaciale EXF-2481]|uniref:Uncharacterized protein n=1 Tax=Aureobasidium subglaciale (strain EXF-2481) TaxID=1043005 RepID=A0A074YJJ0_AURSE|nr:uncharacterized protein AUEXF2481DRAFT_551774 [Aureobasidium subglaciale EXF-2481]KAI5204335.1 hypothetical protein E4T38_04698 [Aureobasidium subglaciale]KAI5223158.1 hypothetical protein E4T40_04704 [Aureobasidium subglaciale]KAI5226770.1 hypothetical protein E4T41_04647 [Aureobasidium subglaciale]KAI5262461.1 hypothetical protein E4T46_04533 [Aureobasidium subglaciale]KEQ97865.1 hypothetical protein AUEXF2481DRAFT_551774 [Aureobasidium subglaciale EXF-2481]